MVTKFYSWFLCMYSHEAAELCQPCACKDTISTSRIYLDLMRDPCVAQDYSDEPDKLLLLKKAKFIIDRPHRGNVASIFTPSCYLLPQNIVYRRGDRLDSAEV